MKKIKLLNFLAILALAVFTLNSCGKTTEFVEGGAVDFNIALKVANTDLILGDTYTIGGTAVEFDVASFYIGGINFISEDSVNTPIDGKYLLVNSDKLNYSVGTLPKGVYSKVGFFIGVGDAENAQTEEDFTTRASSDPLSLQDPAMHWSWNTGYKFLRIDGKADVDGDGTPETAIAYHIGTSPFRANASFAIPEKVDNNTLDFNFDLAKLFDGVDLTTELTTHTGNNPELANKIIANYAKAMTLVE